MGLREPCISPYKHRVYRHGYISTGCGHILSVELTSGLGVLSHPAFTATPASFLDLLAVLCFSGMHAYGVVAVATPNGCEEHT